MKKSIIIILISIITLFKSYSLFDRNHLFYHQQSSLRINGLLNENLLYNDIGLIEKSGTFGIEPYLRKSYVTGYFGFSSLITGFNIASSSVKTARPGYSDDLKSEYNEVGARVRLYFEFPELLGFYFIGDMFISRNSLNVSNQGDLSWWNSFAPYFGETQIGYKNKYFTLSIGFLRMVSSDAIYNHLLVDDYSGPIFGLRLTSMLSRFVDIEIFYGIIRPHQGPWYNGDSVISIDPVTQKDETLYDAYYGKSLYTHKINIRPLPWIRLGIMEGAYFLGENFNPYYANPFFIYIGNQLLDQIIKNKDGSRYNNHAVNLLAGIDFNIGFNGWRFYGEFFMDDSNGNYFKFSNPLQPDKFAFILGFELRGYLITRYVKLGKLADFIISNLYINFEYGIVSKYTYARDSNFNYEYVRNEYKYRYTEDADGNPDYSDTTAATVGRTGNFIGFMYGPNSDCIDVAIGWRSDLWNVKEYRANYQADEYYYSMKKKKVPDRLVKIQLHYRHYRLGDERDVIRPYYYNENPYYDLNTGENKDKTGTSRKTEFLSRVVEIGDILDISAYGDIIRISSFVLGAEGQLYFHWRTFNPYTPKMNVLFEPRIQIGLILSW